MMIKRIGIVALLALAGCSSNHRVLSDSRPNVATVELLKCLPAANAVQSTLLADALLNNGAEAVQKIIQQLDAGSVDEHTTAGYALDLLARHTGNLAIADTRRQMFIATLEQSLTKTRPLANQALLISQFQFCPDPKEILLVQSFLVQEGLCEPASAVLVTIATPAAGQALTDALAHNSDKNKLTLINALGEMEYKPAGPALISFAKEKNAVLKQAASFALGRMGWDQAESILRQNAMEDDHYALCYLDFVKNLPAKERSAQVYRNIFNNTEKSWPENIRMAALTGLVQNSGIAALPDLQQAVLNEPAIIRIPALRLAEPFNSGAATDKWLNMLQTARPEVQADILALLGRQKAAAAMPTMRTSLKSEDRSVRLAAMDALSHTLGGEAVVDLLAQLKETTDETACRQIKQNLLTLPHSALLKEWNHSYPGLSPNGQKLLLEIAIARQDSSVSSSMISALSSSDPGLRLAALEGLKILGSTEAIPAVLTHLTATSDPAETRSTQNCVIEIIKKARVRKPLLEQLNKTFQTANIDQKKNILRIWRGIAGEPTLQQVKASVQNPELADEALRTLCEWPDPTALPALIELAGSKTEANYRILAIRGALRLIRENPMGDLRQLGYLQQIMNLCERTEEKRMVLAEVGKIKSLSAMKYAAGFCKDETIGYEAAVAAVGIATADEHSKDSFPPEQVAAALLQARAEKKLQQLITELPLLKSTLNQPPEGFVALFNGIDLAGWKGLVEDPVKRSKMTGAEQSPLQSQADDDMRKHWSVVDGVLYFDGQGHSLCTGRDYTDFEMWVDWKIEKLGDSGIYLRGAPQVQIWDTVQWPEGSGGLYNNQKNPSKPLVKADKPIGEWNTFHIIMRDERVTVYLNETLVVDNVIMENYWERDKAIYRTGQIELQAHSTPLYFRNVFIKELPSEKPTFNGPLFNGKNLDGWQIINGRPESWQALDGILFTTGQGGGWLSTTREFGDYKLELEFRVPADGNSGVFIRSPHEGDPAYTGMEIQVLDDYAEQYAKLNAWQYTASIYGVQAPAQRVSKHAGEWQTMTVTCLGPLITVELNRQKIIDTNLIEHMDKTKEHPGIKRRSGYIGLQNHSSRLEYRNIRLQELP